MSVPIYYRTNTDPRNTLNRYWSYYEEGEGQKTCLI